jgi:hypothetical protein
MMAPMRIGSAAYATDKAKVKNIVDEVKNAVIFFKVGSCFKAMSLTKLQVASVRSSLTSSNCSIRTDSHHLLPNGIIRLTHE